MKYTASAYLLTITIISFLGYCVENIWLALTQQYIDNRNMFFPFLLGYGLTVVGIYLIFGTPKKWLKKRTASKALVYLAYFALMIVIVSIGEIILGKAVEYFCGFAYWNYEKVPFHFTKYTSVPTSMGFAGIIEFLWNFSWSPFCIMSSIFRKRLCRFYHRLHHPAGQRLPYQFPNHVLQ